MKKILQNYFFVSLAVLMLATPYSAFASETGVYSWETYLLQIVSSLTGPVAYAIAIIGIVVSGFTVMFLDLQGGAKRFVQVGFGASITFFAAQITSNFFHFQGALI